MMRSRITAAVVLALLLLAALPARAGIVTCTRTGRGDFAAGNFFLVVGSCTMSSSYATGGDTFSTNNTAADVAGALCGSNFRKLLFAFVEPSKAGVLYTFDQVNRKIQSFVPLNVGATAVATTANNSLLKVGAGVEVSGTGTAYQVPGGQLTSGISQTGVTLAFQAICQ